MQTSKQDRVVFALELLLSELDCSAIGKMPEVAAWLREQSWDAFAAADRGDFHADEEQSSKAKALGALADWIEGGSK
jgi:hypothetical protein